MLLNHIVTGIITENGKAVGVRFQETGRDKGDAETALAGNIVANAAIPNVANKLLSGEAGRLLRRKIQGWEIGTSLLAVYFGFKKPPRALGNKHYVTIVFDETVEHLKDLAGNLEGDLRHRAFGFCDYSQIDSGLAAEGKSVGSVFVISHGSEWEGLNDEAYRAKKEEAAGIFTERLEALIPGIANEIEFCEVATPKTIERYTANPHGSVYGFAQTPQQAGRYRIRQRSSIENLYFASAWTFPGGGFSGAILAGRLCAEAILLS
jgi:phytoene dehydrogenase-like protein